MIQVVPGRAGGGSFKRKKNHIAEKEFAYRMCARWPTIAMSKLFFGFERSFCRCMAVMSCDLGWCVCDLTSFHQVMWLVVRWFVVLLRYYSVLQRPTTYYSSTTPTCYSVLQRTTPGLLCTTKSYASTTLYYKVLQRTTPVLLCTTKYYSSTTLYYKVLLQYHSVLQSTTPVLLCTTPVLERTSPTDLLWNVIYNAERNKNHRPTSPNTAPATQNECHHWSASHMKRHFQCVEQVKSPSNITKYCACHAKWMSSLICFTCEISFPMRGASKVTLQPHQIVRLPRNLEAPDFSGNSLNASANRKTIRRYSDHIRPHSTIKSSSRTRRFGDLTRPILETILYCKIQHFASRLSPKMSRSAAPATTSPTRTSPNTAPATQNECHHWSASHMKRHFQCVEQVKSPSNITKYCTCHAKWMSSMICVTYEISFPLRAASQVTLQPHQILRLPRNLEAQDFSGYSLNASANRKTIRGYPRIIRG